MNTLLRRRAFAAASLALLSRAARADANLEGRWEGTAQIPGAPMPLVLDLALADGKLGGWITLPGRGVKGMALAEPRREGGSLRVDLSPAFSLMGPPSPAPLLVLTIEPQGLNGRFEQGGHQAPVALTRSGAAQPEPVLRNSVLPAALTGIWRGSYSIAGAPRQVTLTMTPTNAEALIVGRRTTRVPMDTIRLGEHFLTLANREMQITIEGRWRSAGGEVDATFTQGPYEAALVLRKELPR
jgi:hypothetical protein